MEDECDSPILYSAKLTVVSNVHSQSQTQGENAMIALSQLDSLLDYPMSQVQTVNNLFPTRPTTANIVAEPRAVTSTGSTKVRTLDQILHHLSKFVINKANLMHYLDVSDMRMLIYACGERMNAKTTKGMMSDKLLQLIQLGALNQFCSALNLPAVHVNSNISAPVVKQISKGSSETQLMEPVVESFRESNTGVAQKNAPVATAAPAPAPSPVPAIPSKALFLADDPCLWTPVADGEHTLH